MVATKGVRDSFLSKEDKRKINIKAFTRETTPASGYKPKGLGGLKGRASKKGQAYRDAKGGGGPTDLS